MLDKVLGMDWISNPAWWAIGVSIGALAWSIIATRRSNHKADEALEMSRKKFSAQEVKWRLAAADTPGSSEIALVVVNDGISIAYDVRLSPSDLMSVAVVEMFEKPGCTLRPGEGMNFNVTKSDMEHVPQVLEITWLIDDPVGLTRSELDTLERRVGVVRTDMWRKLLLDYYG